MALFDVMASSPAFHQLVQYPDKNLYNAATLLKPEERPTVPVRLYEDPNKLYTEELQNIGGRVPSANAVAIAPPDRKHIFVRKGTMEYADPKLLATKLGHEQVHIQQSQIDELPAYEKEAEIADRFGSHIDPMYRKAMMQYIQGLRDKRATQLEQVLVKRQDIK